MVEGNGIDEIIKSGGFAAFSAPEERPGERLSLKDAFTRELPEGVKDACEPVMAGTYDQSWLSIMQKTANEMGLQVKVLAEENQAYWVSSGGEPLKKFEVGPGKVGIRIDVPPEGKAKGLDEFWARVREQVESQGS